jgi:hypothetical protein
MQSIWLLRVAAVVVVGLAVVAVLAAISQEHNR